MSRSIRLGLFMVTTLALFAVTVFVVGRQGSKFWSNYRVLSEFESVAGLRVGADVRVGGIRKGAVRSIHLPKSPDDKVIVAMDLAKETQSIVKQDSIASIQAEGLLGDKYVEVSFGSMEAERLKGGETIESAPPFDISDLLLKANQILDTSQGALDNVLGVTDNLKMITTKVNTGQGSIGKLINDTTLYQQAAAGVTSLREDADAMKHNFLLRGFFKDRGYTDLAGIKQQLVSQAPVEPPVRRFTYASKNLFDKADSAKLKNQKILSDAGQYLQSQGFGWAVIAVSTGRTGDVEKELVLSEARAFVARKYLVETFPLDDTRLKILGLGKSPTASPGGSIDILVYASTPGPARNVPARK